MFEEEKPKKKKREISAERKAQLLENLKKGRETSRINRAKKAKAKKIIKLEKDEEIDNIIINNRKKKQSNLSEEHQKELNELREFKKQYESRKETKEPPKKDPYIEKKKLETVIEEKPYEKKKASFIDKSLISKVDTETETNFSTFKSSLWS